MQEETGVPGENLPRRVWNQQTKLTYNHWLAALVKGKCSSIKPTRLATGVMCHPDTEQNRPYKIHPWPCRDLNRGPTAPQARTFPVCHTTPLTKENLSCECNRVISAFWLFCRRYHFVFKILLLYIILAALFWS